MEEEPAGESTFNDNMDKLEEIEVFKLIKDEEENHKDFIDDESDQYESNSFYRQINNLNLSEENDAGDTLILENDIGLLEEINM